MNDGTTAIKEPLKKLLACVPQAGHPLLGQAYHLASASHEGQNREAGQPYITHPISVALILASELRFSRDVEMIVAALLHDAVEDSALSLEDIAPTFGPVVTGLVEGVTKVDGAHSRSRSARRAATLQRLFAAARKDPRVLILKLADRVHNMRSLEGIKETHRRERIAQETADVYAPLSYFLGMGRIHRELEDRSLQCLESRVYTRLAKVLNSDPPEAFCTFREEIEKALREQGIRARVRLQSKSLASIHRKILGSSLPILEIDDRYALEVIVSSRDACYRALGVIHNRFIPTMEQFKDFIALPKRNGYQALHTHLIDGGTQFEIHIQTPSMHRMGELGVATLRGDALREERRRRWLHELADWHEQAASSRQLMEELKRILFVREIAVFTPQGDPIILPEGATLVDFAFAVHTDLGLHCTGGIVNGRRATPFSALNWGDTVNIETVVAQHPKRHWLRYVKTYRARRLINRHLSRSEPSGGLMFD